MLRLLLLQRLLDELPGSVTNRKYRTLLMTICAAGLRVSKVVALQPREGGDGPRLNT
jgi:hypothetical protein